MLAQIPSQQQSQNILIPQPVISKLIAQKLQISPISQQSQQIQHKLSTINPKNIFPSKNNFIKSLCKGLHNNIICIYEQQPFIVQIRNINTGQKIKQGQYMQYHMEYKDHLSGASEMKNKDIYNIGSNKQTLLCNIYFQSIPYDCIQYKANNYLISTKSMPPRLYSHKLQQNTIQHIASFPIKKKNSQNYLSPIQFANHANKLDYIIGGGHRFLCSYNLQKMVEYNVRIYQKFDKSNISSVALIDQNIGIIGSFQGWIAIVDFRDGSVVNQINKGQARQIKSIARPHVDAVMSIATTPLNQNIFATSARKDDYTYIWDIRTYSQNTKYLAQLQHPRNGNQRISLNFNNDGTTLYTGTQSSQIIAWKYNITPLSQSSQKQHILKYRLRNKNKTINSIININSQQNNQQLLIFSTGHRVYDSIQTYDDSSQSQKDKQMIDQSEQQTNNRKNILGLFKI